ncbi:hypothetical protein MESS4_520068 [Mesorhizobium sp. STM 4661]|nr:hypothetical protein MESS4_520068 [Mesorhizobium sp. STM 4661]
MLSFYEQPNSTKSRATRDGPRQSAKSEAGPGWLQLGVKQIVGFGGGSSDSPLLCYYVISLSQMQHIELEGYLECVLTNHPSLFHSWPTTSSLSPWT